MPTPSRNRVRPESVTSVSIRPGVSILSVLRHLNYRPWFAIAEFVDNSLQSALWTPEELKRLNGHSYQLKVEINLDANDGGRLRIADNAAGISQREYARAFRPAEIPPDRTGLCEFGMGMKSAACWFAPQWTVRTTALGETVERKVHFDIAKIVRDDIEELDVETRPADSSTHFTEIILSDLYKVPQGNTVKKIKEHLASIYRVFLRSGKLILVFDGDNLTYEDPPILSAPFYKNPAGPRVKWQKEINFDFGLGLRAHGFAAIREIASTSGAGFALFRRNRLIQGSADEGYRPEHVFGKPNSYRYQRLFGELHLDGFEVSHTKDGFRWEEHEDIFLGFLRAELDDEGLPLLEQAEEYRVRADRAALKRGAEIAAKRTAQTLEREAGPVLTHQIETRPETQPPPETLPPTADPTVRQIDVELHGVAWRIVIELSPDPALGDWLTVSDKTDRARGKPERRELHVRLALAHPFMERFAGTTYTEIEPLLRVAAALGLAEVTARESGMRSAGTIRRNVNELLRDALSKP